MSADNVDGYGVRESSAVASDLDVHAEEMKLLGYTVLPSGLGSSEIASLRDRLAVLMRRQELEFGGREVMARIGEDDVGRALLVYDETFLSLAANDRLLGLVERMLGSFFLLSQQNSIVLLPRHK